MKKLQPQRLPATTSRPDEESAGRIERAASQRPLADLIALFGSTGRHLVPMIAVGGKLVGIIIQSDLVAVFGRAANPAI